MFCQRYCYVIGYFILFGANISDLKHFLFKDNNLDNTLKYSDDGNVIVICKENKWSSAEIIRLNELITL